MSYIDKIRNHLSIIEAGGVSDYIINSPIYYYEDDYEDDEDDCEDADKVEERLFDKKVRDGKVVITKNKPGEDILEPITNVKNNANLMKARIKSRTPQANLKRSKSMRVRKRNVDRDR